MTVQTDHPVGCRHHHMQIMGNQQHPAIQLVADILDQLV